MPGSVDCPIIREHTILVKGDTTDTADLGCTPASTSALQRRHEPAGDDARGVLETLGERGVGVNTVE